MLYLILHVQILLLNLSTFQHYMFLHRSIFRFFFNFRFVHTLFPTRSIITGLLVLVLMPFINPPRNRVQNPLYYMYPTFYDTIATCNVAFLLYKYCTNYFLLRINVQYNLQAAVPTSIILAQYFYVIIWSLFIVFSGLFFHIFFTTTFGTIHT